MNCLRKKQAVAFAFDRAASTYDVHADFQREVGEHLLKKLPAVNLGRVLDLGCGTGYFSKRLLARSASSIIALDLSTEMAKKTNQVHPNLQAIIGDAESLPLSDNCVDYAFSSLALQWCDELCVAISELKRVCKKQLVFSTLLSGSLIELEKSWRKVDGQRHINEFLTREAVEQALECAGINQYEIEVKTHTLYFASAKAVMQQLKGIGANYLDKKNSSTPKGLGGSKALTAMYAHYESLREPQGLPASYQVCYVRFLGGSK